MLGTINIFCQSFWLFTWHPLVVKLDVYGFHKSCLEDRKNYLNDEKKRVKINSSFSNCTNILCSVRLGSILGHLLFSIFLCDSFLFLPNIYIASYADDTTPYAMIKSTNVVLRHIKLQPKKRYIIFSKNSMKASPGKLHLILSNTDC